MQFSSCLYFGGILTKLGSLKGDSPPLKGDMHHSKWGTFKICKHNKQNENMQFSSHLYFGGNVAHLNEAWIS